MIDEQLIIKLYLQKYSLRKIENITGISYFKIVKVLEKRGLYQKTEKKRIKWDLKKCEELAQDIDGQDAHCLSLTYINMHTKMCWKCNNPKHEPFFAELNSIYRNETWCPLCWDERRSQALTVITIEDCKKIALARGGVCLSSQYKNGEPLEFKCANNHIFKRTWDELQLNRWCTEPACNRTYRNQEICRQIFQNIFNKEFKEVRLKDIGISEAGKLEYDGYNDELKMAFEYNGKFHFEKVFDNQDLNLQKQNDKRKAELSQQYGITLVQVKYFPTTPSIDRYKYIENILKKYGITYPSDYKKEIKLTDVYYDAYYDEIKKLIEERGGKLISKEILDATSPIEIICDKGHPFSMTPHKLKSGQWCKHNMKNRRLTEEEVKLTIEHYGGEFIRTYRIKQGYFVEYNCDQGHFQKKLVHKVRDGRWCDCPNHTGSRKKNPFTERFDDFSINTSYK